MEISDQRLINEINHGKFIAKKGEEIWNWSSPAGILRRQRRADLFKSYLGNENKQVLEIGCGTGLFTKEAASTNNQITAIDISEDLIGIAKERIPNPNVTFKIENAYQTTFADGSFDFVIGNSILHHLDVGKALTEFHRILKPGGKIIFFEPNMLNPQIGLQKNILWLKRMLGDSPNETAFFKWSLSKKLRIQGFDRIRVTPFDFLHPAIPRSLVNPLKALEGRLEKLPLVKEIAGSLMITAKKEI